EALAEEQHEKLEELKTNSIVLRGDTLITQDALKELGNGEYRAVFVSLEIVFSGARLKGFGTERDSGERCRH
ncbi:hypothetical protein BGX26_007064, partial [Mortierella sp. AD094]